ncbi:MAG: mechanosensitive ion channel domain-containing protein [Bdellovibrionia bacterium]
MEFLKSCLPKIEALGLSIIIAYVLNRVILLFLSRYFHSMKWVPPQLEIKAHFSSSLFWVIFSVSARALLPLMHFPETINEWVDRGLAISFIFFGSWTLTKLIHLFKTAFYSTLNINKIGNLRERKLRTKIQFLEKMILLFIYVLAAALILMHFEEAKRVGRSLIASAGLAGIALGFAAQKSLANLLAGFQIAFTQSIRIDDEVIVENEWGKVEEITLTYVVIRIWDKRALIVPITYFLEKPFQNWTHTSPELLGVVLLHLDYSAPLDLLRQEFQKIIKSSPFWDGKCSAFQMVDSTDKTIVIRLLVGARNAPDAFELRCLVRETLILFLQRSYPETLPKFRLAELETASTRVNKMERFYSVKADDKKTG